MPTGTGRRERRGCVAAAFVCAGCQPAASGSLPEETAAAQPRTTTPVSLCPASDFPIVFSSALSPDFDPRLSLLTPDGSRAKYGVPRGDYQGPVWSPDGRTVALRRRSLHTLDDLSSSVVLTGVDGADQ